MKKPYIFQHGKMQEFQAFFGFPRSFPHFVENSRCEKGNTKASLGFRLGKRCEAARSGKFITDAVDFVFEGAVARHFALDHVDGGKNGRMISSEDLSRVLQRKVRHVADHVDGDMACQRDFGGSLFALDVLDGNVVPFGDVFDDLLGDECGGNRAGNDAGKHVARGIHGDASAVDEAVCAELFDHALKLADIALDVFAEEAENVIGEVDVQKLSLSLQNSDAKLGFGRLDVNDETAFKAALDTLLEVLNVLGRTVRGENDLFACVVKGVERVEKLLLRRNLARDELNIVDQEHIGVAVFFLEFRSGLLFDGADEFVGEILALDQNDVEVGLIALDFVCDRLHQVRFSKSAGAVQEKRIVLLCGIVSNGNGSRVCELVGATDDEVIKGVVLFSDERSVVGRLLVLFLDGLLLGDRLGLCHGSGSGFGIQCLIQLKRGFGEKFDVNVKIQCLFKDGSDIRGVFFIEKIHEGFAGRRDQRALVIEVFQFEIIEPELDDGAGVFFYYFFVNDVPDGLIGIQNGIPLSVI